MVINIGAEGYFLLLLDLGTNKIGEIIGNYNFYIRPFSRLSFKYYLENFSLAANNLYKSLNINYLLKINFIL